MLKIFSGSNTFRNTGIAVVILVIITLLSCEKEVKIDLDSGEPRLVVEGAIETGLPPYVILTKSIGYFNKIDLQTLQNSFEHDAVVTVSDGSSTVTLVEYTIDTGFGGNKFSFYSVDTSAPQSTWMVGAIEKYYTLNITLKDGKTYQATTKIPAPTVPDSVVTAGPPFIPDNNPDARHIRVYFKDPDTIGNYVRYYTKRNNEPFYPGLNSVYPDELINGTQFETALPAGESRAAEMDFDSLGYFHPGDSVILKWCSIDKATYTFWSTYEFALGTIGSPFASPIRVKSNVSNGALGIWGGYGSVYTSLVID